MSGRTPDRQINRAGRRPRLPVKKMVSGVIEFFELFNGYADLSFPQRRESRIHNHLESSSFLIITGNEERYEYFKELVLT
ncbi:MAG: hypothetical protein HN356_13930 [Calditrichaeota bacterium]|nr:hypothetical protein [Calditrichota bacterium]MBT7618676.1 hypothetical protein [Calditrichota bacterium]MBT7789516.1 hypothetical protein [Calditrichota bacterium]